MNIKEVRRCSAIAATSLTFAARAFVYAIASGGGEDRA
jgi:hypothetical protein